jgi:hypothetical protein
MLSTAIARQENLSWFRAELEKYAHSRSQQDFVLICRDGCLPSRAASSMNSI